MSWTRPWTPKDLSALLEFAGDRDGPFKIVMSSRDYADIRKFGRDCLEIRSDGESLKRGFQATFHGVQILCRRGIGKDRILLETSESETLIAHMCFSGPSFADPSVCESCLAQDVMDA